MGLASQVLWRETGACASPCDRPIDCCELGRKRHARYKMAGILHVQAPAEVAHSHGMYRRPSTKQRAPGSWCDWGGLSHSGAGVGGGSACISSGGNFDHSALSALAPPPVFPSLRRTLFHTQTTEKRVRPVECRAARDYLVTLIMQKLAVEWRSTLSSIGTVE